MKETKDARSIYCSYLVEALRQDVESRDAEMSAIRNSIRYRVGGWVLESWPPSRKTLAVLLKLIVGLIRHRRRVHYVERNVSSCSADIGLPLRASGTVVFGPSIPDDFYNEEAVCCNDASSLVRFLDSDPPAGKLVLTRSDQALSRRVQRLRFGGWKVIWWPEETSSSNLPPQDHYLASHADECRSGAAK